MALPLDSVLATQSKYSYMLTFQGKDPMRAFSTVDLLRDLKTVTHAAAREPVAITQHRKPRFVLMAIEDFERLRTASDPRRAYRIEETPRELADLLITGLDRIVDDKSEADDR
jgi:PHD/YefM family antitoxin component YafN of YafNO toxin-antitoxin module